MPLVGGVDSREEAIVRERRRVGTPGLIAESESAALQRFERITPNVQRLTSKWSAPSAPHAAGGGFLFRRVRASLVHRPSKGYIQQPGVSETAVRSRATPGHHNRTRPTLSGLHNIWRLTHFLVEPFQGSTGVNIESQGGVRAREARAYLPWAHAEGDRPPRGNPGVVF